MDSFETLPHLKENDGFIKIRSIVDLSYLFLVLMFTLWNSNIYIRICPENKTFLANQKTHWKSSWCVENKAVCKFYSICILIENIEIWACAL